MSAFLLVILLAAAVKDGPTPLRSGCSPDSPTLASLPAGTPVTIRYSISGESEPCYKVSAQVNGKAWEGYLPATAIGDREEFEDARRQGAWVDTAMVVNSVRASTALPSLRGTASGLANGLAKTAADLIDASRPQKALELLEPELKTRRDPGLLALAGVAAWRSDDSRLALEYWRASLKLAPDASLEKLYRQVEREAQSDQSTERLYGLRVLLRYEGSGVPIDTARQMITVLDQEYSRISQELGCSAQERVIAIVQSRDAYRKSTDTAEWNGGLFDGRIHVPIFNPKVMDQAMLRSLAHEIAHACMTMLGRFPSWLQEGVAQKLSGDSVDPAVMKKLADLGRQGKLPHLSDLKQDWSGLDREHALAAYTLSLAAVELMWKESGAEGVRNLLRNPERLPQVSAELDRRLGL